MALTVHAAYDDDASVWYVESSDIEGLHTEAGSLDDLRAKIPALVEDLIEINDLDLHGDFEIEVIARATVHAA